MWSVYSLGILLFLCDNEPYVLHRARTKYSTYGDCRTPKGCALRCQAELSSGRGVFFPARWYDAGLEHYLSGCIPHFSDPIRGHYTESRTDGEKATVDSCEDLRFTDFAVYFPENPVMNGKTEKGRTSWQLLRSGYGGATWRMCWDSDP